MDNNHYNKIFFVLFVVIIKKMVEMKSLKYFVFLLMGIMTFSCSGDTTVIENKADESVDAPAVSGFFTKRALIEDYTGTWCGNCTRVAQAIEAVFEDPNNKAVTVAIHNGNDPFNFEGIAPLKNLIIPGLDLELPLVRLNRTIRWTPPEVVNLLEVKKLTGNNCGLGLAMTSTVANGNVNLAVKVKLAQGYSNLRLIVYLLENHLLYTQTNYTSDYHGGVLHLYNYEHNNVLRTSMTNILGDQLVETGLTGEIFSKNFSIPVPASVKNVANISFVAFVVDDKNMVVNVRASNSNENQEFEENK